jgi:hypothetical protein
MSHGDNDSDPRARPSGNSEGPNGDIRHPARYTASQDHSVRRRRQATTAQFSSPKGDRQVSKARTLTFHWGLPHLWLYRPGPISCRQPTFTCERGPSPPYQLVEYRSGNRGLQPRCPRCRFGIARPHTCRPTGLALRRLASRVGAAGWEWLKRGLQSRKLLCPPATHVHRTQGGTPHRAANFTH